ncbi:MAG: hypothetical protein Q9181_000242 [Wetmoreana brouardii]
MPRATFPPTPAPSMDIVGKDGGVQFLSKEKTSFTLPPPAIAPAPGRDMQTEEDRRQDASTRSDYPLPPPPSRIRKIIQMTPKMQQAADPAHSATETVPTKTRSTGTRGSSTSRKGAGRKQPSSTSQAGKRIARKTAHSVIERRRRSKMNEEFGVLKDMIPACKDQDMHKLAILQASIEYLRYLEQCITDLKAAHGVKQSATVQRSPPTLHQSSSPEHHPHEVDDEDDEDTDVDMTGSDLPSLRTEYQGPASAYTSPQSMTTSPAIDPFQYRKPTSNTSTLSGLPSPALGPQISASLGYLRQYTKSTSTSPTLVPNSSKEADEEATAALLMLNKDRRNTSTSNSSSSGRGMSVKDLLSS